MGKGTGLGRIVKGSLGEGPIGHVVKLRRTSRRKRTRQRLFCFEMKHAFASHQRKDNTIKVKTDAAEHLTGGDGAKVAEKVRREGDICLRDSHQLLVSFSSNLIDSPQPQASTTFGLRNLKPLSRSETS